MRHISALEETWNEVKGERTIRRVFVWHIKMLFSSFTPGWIWCALTLGSGRSRNTLCQPRVIYNVLFSPRMLNKSCERNSRTLAHMLTSFPLFLFAPHKGTAQKKLHRTRHTISIWYNMTQSDLIHSPTQQTVPHLKVQTWSQQRAALRQNISFWLAVSLARRPILCKWQAAATPSVYRSTLLCHVQQAAVPPTPHVIHWNIVLLTGITLRLATLIHSGFRRFRAGFGYRIYVRLFRYDG